MIFSLSKLRSELLQGNHNVSRTDISPSLCDRITIFGGCWESVCHHGHQLRSCGTTVEVVIVFMLTLDGRKGEKEEERNHRLSQKKIKKITSAKQIGL